MALGQTGRALIASPQMPEERVTALREAFACVTENEDLVSELEEQQRPLAVLDGDETAGLVSEVLDSPESFRELVADSF